MSDPTTGAAAPNDAEIDAETKAYWGNLRGAALDVQRLYARAILARWGAPHASAPAPAMLDMVPPATARDRWMYEQGRLAERDPRTPSTRAAWIEECCALIKAADDAAADRDYMLDSEDCIAVLRGTWKQPLANDCPSSPAGRCPDCGKPTGAPDGVHTCSPQVAGDEALIRRLLRRLEARTQHSLEDYEACEAARTRLQQ